MKRIAIFVETLSGGGIQKVALELANSLLNVNCEVHIFILRDGINYEINNKIELHILSHNNLTNIAQLRPYLFARKINALLQQIGQFNLLISNLGSLEGYKIMNLVRFDKDKVITCVHNTQSKRRFKRHKKSGFLKSLKIKKIKKTFLNKHIVTVSDGVKEDLLHNIGAKPKSIQTIYNPFNFKDIERMALIKDPLVPLTNYIIHVGRFEIIHKRQDILLQAFSKIKSNHQLVLLGEGQDKTKIQELINHLNLEDRVIMPGFCSNPYPFIKNSDLLVLSSDYEGFGNVLAEALILKTPVVSTNCQSGPSEILTDELSDYLTKVGDTNDLVEKIDMALKSYPLIEKKHIQKFSADIITEQYLSFL